MRKNANAAEPKMLAYMNAPAFFKEVLHESSEELTHAHTQDPLGLLPTEDEMRAAAKASNRKNESSENSKKSETKVLYSSYHLLHYTWYMDTVAIYRSSPSPLLLHRRSTPKRATQ